MTEPRCIDEPPTRDRASDARRAARDHRALPAGALGAAADAAPGAERRGYVTPEGIEVCAELLGLTAAEVAAVATFYTMYKRRPVGDYHVGVCTNTLCAVMGGDAIFAAAQGPSRRRQRRDHRRRQGHARARRVQRRLRLRAGRDGQLGVLRQPDARTRRAQLVDDLRAGVEVEADPRRAAVHAGGEAERVLAGFPDGRADEGPSAGDASLVGLRLAAATAGRRPSRERRRPEDHRPARRRGDGGRQGAVDDRADRDRRRRSRRRHRARRRQPTEPRGAKGRMTDPLTPVLTANWDQRPVLDARRVRRRGRLPRAAQGAAAWTPTRSSTHGQGLRPARPRRRGLPDRHEVGLHPAARRQAALPRRQRRRVRAGHLQGHPADDGQPAHAGRGRHHLVVRDPGPARVHLRARRGAARRAPPAAGGRGGLRRRATSARTSSAPATTSTSSCTPAPVPTSAARRPRCSTRSRVGAASRGCVRRSPRSPACTPSPTVINNVESIASRARDRRATAPTGSRSMGTEKSQGLTLYSLSGHVTRPGQYEAPLGITLRELLELAGGIRAGHELKFWTPGGSSTPMLTARAPRRPARLRGRRRAPARCSAPRRCRSSTRPPAWSAPCCAGPSSTSTSRAASAPRAARAPGGWSRSCERLEHGQGHRRGPRQLLDLCDNILGRSFCALGDGAASPITSSIEYFRDEYLAHFEHGGCPFDPAEPRCSSRAARLRER